jgi:hypothetical protein
MIANKKTDVVWVVKPCCLADSSVLEEPAAVILMVDRYGVVLPQYTRSQTRIQHPQ